MKRAHCADVLEVDGICYYGLSTIRAHFCHYSLGDCAWEDESAVVVGVLANEVDTSRRMVNVACKTVKMLYEATSYVFNIHVVFIRKQKPLTPTLPPLGGRE